VLLKKSLVYFIFILAPNQSSMSGTGPQIISACERSGLLTEWPAL